jgi:hypothetical protein
MKLFYKILIVFGTLCFIFIVALGNNLAGHKLETVLYDKNDCSGKLLIQEKGGTICIRSKAEFHPGPVAKLLIE